MVAGGRISKRRMSTMHARGFSTQQPNSRNKPRATFELMQRQRGGRHGRQPWKLQRQAVRSQHCHAEVI